jgi:ATP-dependent protease Clp ATPase subunit
MEPEFVGRLPVRVACQSLTSDDLEEILLTSEGSILQQYRADFAGYKIDFDISGDAVTEVAQRAQQENTGARGLMTVLEQTFRNFKFELPSTGIRSFKIVAETVRDPETTLRGLLAENASDQREVLRAEVQAFADRFHEAHGFELQFGEDAITALIEQSLDRDKTIRALCEERFHNFHHGLLLLAKNEPDRKFQITAEVVADPEKAISQWVVERFREPPAEAASDSTESENPPA